MSTGLVLALDQGGQSSRAIVFDATGRSVARARVEVGEVRSGEDRVEQDPEEIVRSLRRATKDALKFLGKRGVDLVAAGLATQRSSVVAWDKETGGALTPVISWQDRRAKARVEELSSHAALFRERTGLRLSPHYGASKLAWMLAEVPAVGSALREGRLAFGPLSSFLAFRLLEEHPFVADPANASRTLLFDMGTRRFDPTLCDLFGVPLVALPKCVPTRALHGSFNAGARPLALNIITGDQSAALFADGEPKADEVHVNFGTGVFVQRTFDDASLEAPRLLRSIVHADGSRVKLALEGTVNGGGSALRFAIEALNMHDVEPDLEGWLARELDPPVFVNGVSGLGAPFWIPDLESRFIGAGTPEAQIVAVLESVVFLVRAILDEMAQVLQRPRIVRVGGGLAQLDGLCQRLADLCGVPVERADDPEATARGSAWLVHAEPHYEIRVTRRFEPRANSALHERCERMLAAIRGTQP